MFVFRQLLVVLKLAVLCLLHQSVQVHAQILMKDVPLNARGIDVEDRTGLFVPLDLLFNDERGNKIGFGKFFNQGRPIVLTLNYSDCPGLCIAQLENLVSTLRETNGEGIGSKFEIVTVSIDPTELPMKAARTKEKYVGMLGAGGSQNGWHFLTGDQASISKLANAVGFKYTYDKINKRYNHPAVTYFISSEGRICRYFLSLGTEPAQFRLAVSEAAQGKLGRSISDVIMQLCYQYDPDSNRYTAAAHRIMFFGWGVFALMMFGCIAPYWFTKRGVTNQIDAVTPKSSNDKSGNSELVTPDAVSEDTHDTTIVSARQT